MNADAVVTAWTEFCKAQAEGITDIRSMERALAAAEKHIVADIDKTVDEHNAFARRAEPLRERIAELEARLARSEANAQMWFDIVEEWRKALRSQHRLNPDQIESFAIRAALGNNGGIWAEHYTEEQKEHWRRWVRDMAAAMQAEAAQIAEN